MGSNGRAQKPTFDGLALSRQGSLYNLTLDEVQEQLGYLGKPFSSMNLDEFLKNVWTAEANQGVNNGASDYSELNQLASASSLPRQLSLTFSKDLTKKTVDEVWQDIQQSQNKKKKSNESYKSCDRQATLGEMTLEDFLVKAGIVAEDSSPGKKGREMVVVAEQNVDPQWMQYQMQQQQQQQVVMPGHYQVPAVMENAYVETRMTGMSPTPLMGNHVSEFGRKRGASGEVVEKTVERRQKRMIKNRESAARSRARKQAYTHELENKISRLEEENERLRRQKDAEKVLPSVPPPQPKYQLRRTASAPL